MTEPLCDSCGEWTDPATLQDGDCPGCVAVRPDKTEQALAVLEQKWRRPTNTGDFPADLAATLLDDDMHIFLLDTQTPITPAQLKERGFPEPEI